MAEVLSAEELIKGAGGLPNPEKKEAKRPPRDGRAPVKDKQQDEQETPPEPEQPSIEFSRDEKALIKALSETYTLMGMSVSLAAPEVGMTIVVNGEECATAWVVYARTNPRVKKALKSFISTSALGSLIMAHAPIAVAIGPMLQQRFRPQPREDDINQPPPFVPGT